MIGKQKDKEGYVLLSTKIKPEQADVLNAICNVLGVNTYNLFQMFFYVLTKAAAPMHETSPEIRKLLTLMESDASWQEAFNLANPAKLKVAQAILILEQEGRKGFGAVMVDKPFMGKSQQTENIDYILERVTEVTMHGIYRRLRLLGASMECKHLSDILLTMIDTQTSLELDEQTKAEIKGEAMFDERGRAIEYGKKSKSIHHRTPDGEEIRQQTIIFTEEDRKAARKEAET